MLTDQALGFCVLSEHKPHKNQKNKCRPTRKTLSQNLFSVTVCSYSFAVLQYQRSRVGFSTRIFQILNLLKRKYQNKIRTKVDGVSIKDDPTLYLLLASRANTTTLPLLKKFSRRLSHGTTSFSTSSGSCNYMIIEYSTHKCLQFKSNQGSINHSKSVCIPFYFPRFCDQEHTRIVPLTVLLQTSVFRTSESGASKSY